MGRTLMPVAVPRPDEPRYAGNLPAYLRDLARAVDDLQRRLVELSRERDKPTSNRYTVENGATTTHLDVTAAATGDVAAVLGTLITDLKAKGELR